MSLQPAHPKWWYEIQQLFTTSLVIQELLAVVCCLVCLKVRSLIPDISDADILPTTNSRNNKRSNYHF